MRALILVVVTTGCLPSGSVGVDDEVPSDLIDRRGGAFAASPPVTDATVPALRQDPVLRGRFAIVRDVLGSTSSAHRPPVLGDCNGDGLVDVIEPVSGDLWLQRPGRTWERSAGPGTPASTMADLDSDGVLDLLGGAATLTVRRGRGGCAFAPTWDTGVALRAPPTQINVQDVDGDGKLDALVSFEHQAHAFQIVHNRGAYWEDRTPPPTPPASNHGLASPYSGFGTFLFDLDGDGMRDLFALVDSGRAWFAWGQPGGAWVREDRLLQLYAANNPMAASPLDADRDGRLDLFVASTCSTGGGVFLFANGGRRAVSAGDVAGTASTCAQRFLQWSSYAVDVNMDGWLDLLLVYTDTPSPSGSPGQRQTRPGLYLNRGDGIFIDRSDVFPVEVGGEAMMCGDLASDGRVGCVVATGGPPLLLWSEIGHDGNWIGISGAEGALVTVEGEAPPQVVLVGRQSASRGMHAPGTLVSIGARQRVTVRVERVGGRRAEVLGEAGRYYDIDGGR